MKLESWHVNVICSTLFIAYFIDQFFFQKKRIKKWSSKYKKEVVDGIVEDLKRSDQVLVIHENEKLIKALEKFTGETWQ